ncbi:DUF6056 family protein [Runella salmonicolor]|uniref:Transmembrane protein n=1 Tax=Runella salmonicolor TaxID=2950278 RepID=A0ABT1FLG5_9BACT|nr:DUF6056 family protein [Runella salmonicolor]MCP1382594.1 hypothetical protein [Runella salmonicolor]
MLKTLQKPLFQNLFNIGLLTLVLIPLLALACYNHPSPVDDYCYIDTVFKYGYFEAMNFYYTGWTGRYFGILMNHSNPLILKWPGGFKLLSFLLILGLTSSLFALAKEVFPKWSRLGAFGLVGGLLFLFILKIASIAEAFYWMAAFVTYTVPNALTIYWLVVMLRWYQLPKGNLKNFTSVLAGFLVFAVIGCSETNLTIMVLLVAGWWGYQLVINRTWDWFAVFLVAVAAISCYIFFTSPGNLLRMSGNPEGRNIPFSALQSIKLLARLSIEWMTRTPLLVFTILWIAVLPKIFVNQQTMRYFSVPLWVAVLAYFGILFVQIFPSYYGIGIEPAPRVINSIYLYFLIGWFYCLAVLVRYFYQQDFGGAKNWYLPPSIKLVLAILIVVSALFSQNFRMVYGDWLRGRAAAYDSELKQRYEYIENTPGDRVYVEPLKARPQSLFLDDANPDPKHWWAKCMGGYFGKKEVVLKTNP